ncbi:MAG: class E sortase [Solirubrobacteraceae bacterium]
MSEIVFTVGRRRKRPSRLARPLAWTLIAFGCLALADAIVTIVWQEPFSAVYASVRQSDLEGELNEIERRAPTLREAEALERARDERHRVYVLAREMERKARPGSAIGHIDIPKIGSDFVLIDGTGTSELEAGPGIYSKRSYPGVAFPGVPGTTAIAGHRTTFLEPFKHIAELRRGEHIYITMPYARFTYTILGERAVLPTDTGAVIGRTRNTRLVLSSCTPEFTAEKRLLVYARLTRQQPLGRAVVRRSPEGSRLGGGSGGLLQGLTHS